LKGIATHRSTPGCGFSLFLFDVVIGVLNDNYPALRAQPTFTGSGIGAHIGRVVVRDDVKNQGLSAIVFDLMGVTWMTNEMVASDEAFLPIMLASKQSRAGENDVKLGLGSMRVHRKIDFSRR
jgi:hypothetical protein